MPEIIRDKAAMRAWSRAQRAAGAKIAFVPTMGALHEGHLSLVQRATTEGDRVVVSIYVNPTQFAPHEDFDVYPRDLSGDLAKLAPFGVAAVFAPGDLYDRGPGGGQTEVRVTELERPLCGVSRPHFFGGVATVVTKLFHIVEPDVAVFGRKDYQQWRIIQRMVRDLDLAIEIVGAPIVREPDGLAMSSRNLLLEPAHRAEAPAINQALEAARERAAAGERDLDRLLSTVRAAIEAAGGRVDYVEGLDAETLQPVSGATRLVLAAVAAWFGEVRLIDNRELPWG